MHLYLSFLTDRNYKRQDEWPVTLPPQPVRDRFAVRRDVDAQVISYRSEPIQLTFIHIKLALMVNMLNYNFIAKLSKGSCWSAGHHTTN